MAKIIQRKIDDDEILVRFVFEKDFKSKILHPKRIKDKEIFLDTRGGVSLQREKYSKEKQCKVFAKLNPNKFVGFLIFQKKDFTSAHKEHNLQRPGFLAKIKASPLDKDWNLIDDDIETTTSTPGNPAHADLNYLNPAAIPDESPKTAIRVFSRKLFKKSKLIIDDNPELENFTTCKFSEVI